MASGQTRLFYVADTGSGLACILHQPQTSSSQTEFILRFVPRDTNGLLNVAGVVSAGTFSDLNAAKNAAADRYGAIPSGWKETSVPLQEMDETVRESPQVEGHQIRAS